jgi:hypothetical protein
MRISKIAGIALIAAGTAVLVWGGAFTSSQDLLEAGGVAGALIAGVTLMVMDTRRKASARLWR